MSYLNQSKKILFAFRKVKPDFKRNISLKCANKFTANQQKAKLACKILRNDFCSSKFRCISSSSSTKIQTSSPVSNDSPKKELNQNVLDDEEFQNILKDFANDFGVGEDSTKILDDIKKQIDETDTTENLKHSSGLESTNEKDSYYILADGKFKTFSDADATIIHSYEDYEAEKTDQSEFYHINQEFQPKSDSYQTKRGVTGVFDIDELVDVIKEENLLDISVFSIPKSLCYADYMVLATAKSPRHARAISELILKLYKMKKGDKDPFIKIEGKDVSSWKVLDMGNIVLHIFMQETRNLYDLESLWLFDINFDSGGSLPKDPVLDSLEEQMAFFHSLQQAETSVLNKEVP